MMRVMRKQTSRSLSYPKILLWVWHRLKFIIYEGSRVIFHSRCHTQRRNGGAAAGQCFFGYDNDKDLKVCFFLTRINYEIKQVIRLLLTTFHHHLHQREVVKLLVHDILKNRNHRHCACWNIILKYLKTELLVRNCASLYRATLTLFFGTNPDLGISATSEGKKI